MKKNTSSHIRSAQGVARPRIASQVAVAAALTKKVTPAKVPSVTGAHSVMVLRITGFVEMSTA